MPVDHSERDALNRKRDLRAHREELQRVQIGLVGLAGVLLIVTLANLVVDTVRRDGGAETAVSGVEFPSTTLRPGSVSNSSSVQKSGGNEPLADLGVTPTTTDAMPVLPSPVPDLEPDPQLRQRMDQDPEQPRAAP